MEPFKTFAAIAAPIDLDNVDTDMIIPARFLRKPRSAGYGNFLFADVRRLADGTEKPDFVLNKPAYRDARILVSGMNFGCGSSRVGAVYAIADSGIRCVIATSFGDIFANSCVQHGVLPVVLSADHCAALRLELSERPGATVSVSLVKQTVTGPDGSVFPFEIAAVSRERLLRGLDDIGRVLLHAGAVSAFEERYYAAAPWCQPATRLKSKS